MLKLGHKPFVCICFQLFQPETRRNLTSGAHIMMLLRFGVSLVFPTCFLLRICFFYVMCLAYLKFRPYIGLFKLGISLCFFHFFLVFPLADFFSAKICYFMRLHDAGVRIRSESSLRLGRKRGKSSIEALPTRPAMGEEEVILAG